MINVRHYIYIYDCSVAPRWRQEEHSGIVIIIIMEKKRETKKRRERKTESEREKGYSIKHNIIILYPRGTCGLNDIIIMLYYM